MHVAVTLDGRQHVDSCQPRNNWPAINFCTHWKLTPTPGSTIVHARHSRSRSSLDWIIDQPLQRSTGSACSRRRVRATFFAIRSKQFGKFRRWRWRWEEKNDDTVGRRKDDESTRDTFDGKSRRNSNGALVSFGSRTERYRFRYTECACAVPRQRRPKTTLRFSLFSTSFSPWSFLPPLDFPAALAASRW